MKVKLDLNKSVEENAASYFDKAKKAKKKIEGAKKALEKSLLKLKSIKVEEVKIEPVKKKISRKPKWYEKFRWFYSSEGHLIVGGRDATSNEIVIKKHTEKDDIVFHTDMAGSGFFIIKKTKGKKLSMQSYEEAATACATFSKAWKLGLSNLEVFYVKPDQVTKEANPGEYLPKGAFMIRGKTKYLNPSMDLALGIYDDAVMAGPKSAISDNCTDYVRLIQGKEKASAVAKFIKGKIGGELDDIIRALPAGGFEISNR